MKNQISNISGGSIAASAPLVNSAPAPRWIRLVLKVGEDFTVLHFRLPAGWGRAEVQQWGEELASLLAVVLVSPVERIGSSYQVRLRGEAHNLKRLSFQGPKGIEIVLKSHGKTVAWIPVRRSGYYDLERIEYFGATVADKLFTDSDCVEATEGQYSFRVVVKLK